MIAKSLNDSGAVTIRRPPPPDSLARGAVVAQEDSSERATAGNAGHVSVEERRDDREGPHGRDQADDQAGDHGEGVPGPAQQLPCDVFQIHGDCTWQPRGGRESASIDAFLEGCKAFHNPIRARARKVNATIEAPSGRLTAECPRYAARDSGTRQDQPRAAAADLVRQRTVFWFFPCDRAAAQDPVNRARAERGDLIEGHGLDRPSLPVFPPAADPADAPLYRNDRCRRGDPR